MVRRVARIVSVALFGAWLVLGTVWAGPDSRFAEWHYSWHSPQLIAALLFGVVVVVVAGRRPPLLPLLLGMTAVYIITSSVWGFIPTGALIRTGMLGTWGQATARDGSWALVLALLASSVLGVTVRARGGWAPLGWWSGTFIWVYGFAWVWGLLLGPGAYEYAHWPLSSPPWHVVWGACVAFGLAGPLVWVGRRTRREKSPAILENDERR